MFTFQIGDLLGDSPGRPFKFLRYTIANFVRKRFIRMGMSGGVERGSRERPQAELGRGIDTQNVQRLSLVFEYSTLQIAYVQLLSFVQFKLI